MNRSNGGCVGMKSRAWYSKVPSAWSVMVSSGESQAWEMCR